MEIADGGSGVQGALAAAVDVQTKRGSFQIGQGMAVIRSDGERVGELRAVRPMEADIPGTSRSLAARRVHPR